MQTLATIEKALKENYLPAWQNQLGIEPSPLLGKIKKTKVVSDKIVTSAPIGLSGGFGFGAEGQATPASGNVQFQRFETNTKDMYVNICLSQKAVKLTGPGGSMANALTTEVQGAYDTAKWNVGRALFGNGTGILTTISALGTAGNTITVADTAYVKEGLIIDIYATGGTSPQTNGKGRRITAVDRVNNTITISGDASTFNAGFITVQNSYNREFTGLGAIFDDNITSLYGVTKSSNPFIYPIVKDANNDIDDSVITGVLRRAEREKNSQVNMILCGDNAYDHYTAYLRENNIRVEERSKEISGGFKAISFIFGNREVEIVNENFVPSTEMWGVDTKMLELHQTDWTFADLQGGGIFNLMENQSVYRALLTNYGELICKNPGGCIRITNAA